MIGPSDRNSRFRPSCSTDFRGSWRYLDFEENVNDDASPATIWGPRVLSRNEWHINNLYVNYLHSNYFRVQNKELVRPSREGVRLGSCQHDKQTAGKLWEIFDLVGIFSR